MTFQKFSQTYPDRVANLVVVDISPVAYSQTQMHTAIIGAQQKIKMNKTKITK